MSVVTFGELFSLAKDRLAAAEATMGDAMDEQTLRGDLARLITALDGATAGVLRRRGIGPTIPRHGMTAWERAASEIHEELGTAAELLATPSALEDTQGPLAAAAVTLTAATDLLATHYKLLPDGELIAATPWADAVASPPVTRALTAQIASWAELLVPWARWLAIDNAGLASASRCLKTAGKAARHAQQAEPVITSDIELLYGIPAATPPSRIPPGDSEPIPDLCTGIVATAERLRLAAFSATDYAAWSPAATARAWQQVATAAGIVTDTAGIVLRTVARERGPEVYEAAGSLRESRQAWRNVVAAWTDIKTEVSMVATRTNTEASDLVLRMGSLAFDNPRWTPAREHHGSPIRAMPDGSVLPEIIGALHQAADALAITAQANLAGVRAAGEAGRFYVPTRCLPEALDVPRLYAPALREHVAGLVDAYKIAVLAAESSARRLGQLAQRLDAPSRVLALARNATARVDDNAAPRLAAQDNPRTHAATRPAQGRFRPTEPASTDRTATIRHQR